MANSYLARTPSSTGNRKTFTFSAWVKRSKLLDNYPIMFKQVTDASNFVQFYFDNQDQLAFYVENGSGSGYTSTQITNRRFRDVSAWYHVMVAVDTTQASADNRVKIYVNGNQETSFSTNTQINQNIDVSAINTTGLIEIGRASNNSSQHFNGYMTHVSLVDGQQLTPTSFGQTDSTSGIWKFKGPTGLTWGTNGFHLKFENSGNLGLDSSGQTNNFTTNGNLKQSLDTPSNVHCTINPLYRGDLSNNATLSDGNTTFSSDQSGYNIRYGTLGVTKGKWYYECKFISQNNHGNSDSFGMPFGISGSQIPAGQQNAGYAQYDYSYNYDGSNGVVQVNNNANNYGTTILNAVGQIGMCAFDLDNNKVYFGVNGVWTNSGNPGGNANGFTIADPNDTELGFYFPSTADRSSNRSYVYSFNFGDGFFGTTAISSAGSNGNGSLFEYDVPSGYYALNTKNINTYG